ncbi:rap guanine nucleotide exchange factor 2-like isoform X4 [Centruroides sculpturatus]|uniref:rap guanine nucleotide exchange factor 2-like isoform X4 n=1 Tax=Centruroides sculpturatus TaxID=218467 RepID=UPI000C6CA77C|nr:rap guanine nucleotide exchange factor 2-like isoform X4 [Centruroides sculpturatus]
MFAILSGLGHGAVSRLRVTWEKLPTKYQKIFEDLQDLMDPSRNMCKYRNLINSEHIQPPIIPFYPVVKKDLTFIHLGNDTFVDNLVNFEKLRMIAKEIRQLMNMCSAPYDLFNMLEIGGAQPSAAMASLNSFAAITNAATIKRRKKSTAQPNPKKMFEEAQMVRRVKAYLGNLKVISDEEQLHNMSIECEPTTGTGSMTSVQPRKRHPSPTLSTASSTSSTSEGKKSITSGPRFVSHSPPTLRMRPNGPLFPHGMPVLPPLPGPAMMPSHMMAPPPPPRDSIPGHMFPPARARRPPEYNIAAQMAARSRQMAHLGRAHSHEGSTTGYYSSDVTDPEDDDDAEAQVSAV